MADFGAHSLSSGPLDADVLVVPLAAGARIPRSLARISSSAAERAERALELKDFEAKSGARFLIHGEREDRCPRVLLAGLGEGASLSAAAVRKAMSTVARDPLFDRMTKVALLHEGWSAGKDIEARIASAIDGFLEGTYRWSAATEKKSAAFETLLVAHEDARLRDRILAAIERGKSIGASVALARDLANTPPNRMSPEDLGKAALAMAKEHGLQASVLGPKELERERMHALLAVGQGSDRPPRLIVVRHDPGSSEKPVALVGKGIVFDSGGYTIKPLESMVEMKYDKSGACAVLGAMQAVARLRLPIPVVAVVAAAENMISGSAYRTGDVIESRGGKTIEVLNTDAEGRLVLADAIDYAITEHDPQAVVDIATLTGAVYYALGDHSCAVFGDDRLVARLREAGDRIGERAWPLPLGDEYAADVNTPNADVRNTSAWGAGAIAGAAFLQRFTRGVPWAHLDVASVSRDRRVPSRGATGFGTRLLVDALQHWPRSRAKTKRVARRRSDAKARR